jgi:hypothetical protein
MKYVVIAVAAICMPAFGQETAPAIAGCSPPVAPAQVILDMPSPPANPACAPNDDSDSGKCNRKEIENFNAKVDAYNKAAGPALEKLNAYEAELQRYKFAVNEYANCEISRLNKLIMKTRG